MTSVFVCLFFVSSICEFGARYTPWRLRMENEVEKFEEQKIKHGKKPLFTANDVAEIENLDQLKFSIKSETTMLVECPFTESWSLDSRFMPGCKRCKVVHSCDGNCTADVVFRFGYGRCTSSPWPAKSNPSQIFSSTIGEARTGSGKWYHESASRNDEDVSVCFAENCDIMYSFSEFVTLSNLASSPRISHVASQWLAPLDLLSKTSSAHALFINSNCHTLSSRNHVVTELRNSGVLIDSAGQCLRNVDTLKELPQDKSRYSSKIRAASTYRFLFALENTIETFYITEKLHHAYLAGSVPIVWKRDIVEKAAPHHSFIAIDDYSSLKELAQTIIYLANNNTAYKEYFRWKEIGVQADCVKMWFLSIDLVGCQLCEMHSHSYYPRKSHGKK